MASRLLGTIVIAGAAALGCGGIAVLPGAGAGGAGGGGGTTSDPTLGCDPGKADCNGAAEDGCEVDLASDPSSCGACGHGCQGGACQTSVCQPVIVATGQEIVYRLAATESALYWTRADGSVLRAREGEAPEVIAELQNGPGDIAVNGTHVYWASVGDGTIARAPLDGKGAEIVVTGLAMPWSLAVTDQSLAWTDNSTGEVTVMALDGAGAKVVVGKTEGAWGVALGSTHVYWTTLFYQQLLRAPIAGGAAETLAEGISSPQDLALSGDRVFFGTASDAGVYTVAVTGGATTKLTESGGFGVAADDTHVYFGEYDGRLARVPLGGGEVEILGLGQTTPSDVALTSKSVYWTAATSDGVLMKVAK